MFCVGRNALDFEDQETLTIALSGGQVLVDDELVGSYTRGDALDLAWRSLLGDVISLDDGPLAEALTSWSPPADLPEPRRESAYLHCRRRRVGTVA